MGISVSLAWKTHPDESKTVKNYGKPLVCSMDFLSRRKLETKLFFISCLQIVARGKDYAQIIGLSKGYCFPCHARAISHSPWNYIFTRTSIENIVLFLLEVQGHSHSPGRWSFTIIPRKILWKNTLCSSWFNDVKCLYWICYGH